MANQHQRFEEPRNVGEVPLHGAGVRHGLDALIFRAEWQQQAPRSECGCSRNAAADSTGTAVQPFRDHGPLAQVYRCFRFVLWREPAPGPAIALEQFVCFGGAFRSRRIKRQFSLPGVAPVIKDRLNDPPCRFDIVGTLEEARVRRSCNRKAAFHIPCSPEF